MEITVSVGKPGKDRKPSGKQKVETDPITPVTLGVRGRIHVKIWASVFDIIMYPLSRWFGDRE